MKQGILSVLPILLVVAFSCTKSRTVLVIRDCTGTYLRSNGKDYRVCNLEKVANYADGDAVSASFKKIKSCSENDAPACLMAHEYESWIDVKKID